MTSDASLSVRVPKRLKMRVKDAVTKYGYTNESDFLREAVRLHLLTYDRKEVVKGEW